MEKQRSMVSVVMPVYNAAPFLQETMESVLQQTFKDFEFIIIDDRSSDDSWSILSRYASNDSRIHLYRHEKNLGALETSNELLGLAKGDYIARQDHDDISLPARLEKQVQFMVRHPEVGLLGCAYYRMNHKREFRLCVPPQSHTAIRWSMLFDCVFCHSSVMIRRSVFHKNEKYVFVSGAGDYEMWVRLSRRSRCSSLKEPLLVYRENAPNSMMVTLGDGPELGRRQISEPQIRSLIPGAFTEDFDLNRLRRLRSPKQIDKDDVRYARQILELFHVFQKDPDVDPSEVRKLRKEWIRRAMICVFRDHWRKSWCYKFAGECLAEDLLAPLRILMWIFRKLIYRIKAALGIGNGRRLKGPIFTDAAISASDNQL